MAEDIRWKQRFQNFDRAYRLLSKALAGGPDILSDLEKEGVAQRFEYTFELAWNLLKDYLQEIGIVVIPIAPREVLKQAFAAEILRDGQVWMDMLKTRNSLSHSYDEEEFENAVETIAEKYLPAFGEMHQYFGERLKS